MSYKITNYSKNKAKEYNVIIKPSKKKNKKLDVYDKDDKLIASIGAKGYSDYPTYILNEGKEYADTRRKLYKIRHQKDRIIKNTPGFWADRILW
jgi:hypothetical protein